MHVKHFCKSFRDVYSELHHGIRVGQEVLEKLQKSLIFDELSVDVMQLSDAHGGSFAHVRIFIL